METGSFWGLRSVKGFPGPPVEGPGGVGGWGRDGRVTVLGPYMRTLRHTRLSRVPSTCTRRDYG